MKKRDLVAVTHKEVMTETLDGKKGLERKKLDEPVEGFVVGRSWGLFESIPEAGALWLVVPMEGVFFNDVLICLEEDVIPMPSFEEMPSLEEATG